MRTYSYSDKISLGRGDGTKILTAIKNAKKSIKIVSPYLSPSYLEELIRLRKKGVKITLITSDNLTEGNHQFSTFKDSDVIKQKKILNPEANDKKKNLKKISITFFLVSIITFLLSLSFSSLTYISVILVIIGAVVLAYSYSISGYKYYYYSIFRLKAFDSASGEKPQSTNLVHSKIFVIDEKTCFLGSANFTYSGFKVHYETVIEVEDPKAIKDISQEVENLFNSTELKAKDINKWGKEIYEQNIF